MKTTIIHIDNQPIRIQELKSWPLFMDLFQYSGVRFDVRVNDRNFQKDDYLLFREYDSNQGPFKYKSRALLFRVSYMLSGWGVSPGHIALGLLPVEHSKATNIALHYEKKAYPLGVGPGIGICIHELSSPEN